MKSLSRFIFGFTSTCLLCVGFARAADHLDPISRACAPLVSESTPPAPPCTAPCDDDLH